MSTSIRDRRSAPPSLTACATAVLAIVALPPAVAGQQYLSCEWDTTLGAYRVGGLDGSYPLEVNGEAFQFDCQVVLTSFTLKMVFQPRGVDDGVFLAKRYSYSNSYDDDDFSFAMGHIDGQVAVLARGIEALDSYSTSDAQVLGLVFEPDRLTVYRDGQELFSQDYGYLSGDLGDGPWYLGAIPGMDAEDAPPFWGWVDELILKPSADTQLAMDGIGVDDPDMRRAPPVPDCECVSSAPLIGCLDWEPDGCGGDPLLHEE
jgi:hypothetical protein